MIRVGSNWGGFVGGLDKVNALLGIPADLDVLAILPFGYPAESLEPAARGLRHVTLLQGTTAYDSHVEPARVPAEGR